MRWHITDPFPSDGELTRFFPPEKSLQAQYIYEGKNYGMHDAIGAGIYLRHVWGSLIPGAYKDPQLNHTTYTWTWIYSPKAQEVGTRIEFRDCNRSEMDLPPMQGKWDYRESHIWVNDQEIIPPVRIATRREKPNEIPLGNENCVGRKPTPTHLEKDWNKVLMKLSVNTFNTPEVRLVKWMLTSACVTPNGKEVAEGLVYSPDKRLK